MAQWVGILPAMQETHETWFDPWMGKWYPTPVFLPGKSHGQRSLAGYIQYMGLDMTKQQITIDINYSIAQYEADIKNLYSFLPIYKLQKVINVF